LVTNIERSCRWQSSTYLFLAHLMFGFLSYNCIKSCYIARKPASQLLYAEFSQLPFQHHWATLVFRFWNSMTSGDEPSGSLCRAAFRSDVRMALVHRHGWVHDVLGFLLELGFDAL
jgi:hypothetical protein